MLEFLGVLTAILILVIVILVDRLKANKPNEDNEAIKLKTEQLIEGKAGLLFEEWKRDYEAETRKDAIAKSQSVSTGKMVEQLCPYFPEFPYNPKDARFIGSPLDFLIFDGLSEGDLKEVVFVEVKTGKSNLNARERQVRDAIKDGRVKWQEIRPTEHGDV
jgi:predicted Holliday junction resolvase-like endonuclease